MPRMTRAVDSPKRSRRYAGSASIGSAIIAAYSSSDILNCGRPAKRPGMGPGSLQRPVRAQERRRTRSGGAPGAVNAARKKPMAVRTHSAQNTVPNTAELGRGNLQGPS